MSERKLNLFKIVKTFQKVLLQERIANELKRIAMEKEIKRCETFERSNFNSRDNSFSSQTKSTDQLNNNGQLDLFNKIIQNGGSEIESTRESSIVKQKHKDLIKEIDHSASRIHITLKKETLDKVEKIKGLLAHKHMLLNKGSINYDELIDYLADIAIEKLEKKKFAINKNVNNKKVAEVVAAEVTTEAATPVDGASPKNVTESAVVVAEHKEKATGSIASNSITFKKNNRNFRASAKREIYLRAKEKCEICGSVHKLEIDHIRPYALGGRSDASNA